MKPESGISKFLRTVGILLMSITAGFTILGGAGTSCAALFPTNWESMAPLAPFQWLYILFVVVTIAIGVLGIRAVVMLAKGKPGSYKAAMLALVLGVVVGVIHIIVSRSLRGSSMPVDAVVYITVLTLILFLLFRIPSIWSGVDYTKAPRKEGKKSAGIASITMGLICLTIQFLMAPTHTWGGVNYADAFHFTMTLVGCTLLITGFGMLTIEKLIPTAIKLRIKSVSRSA